MGKLLERIGQWGLRWSDTLDLFYPRDCLMTGRLVENESPYRYLGLEAARRIILSKPPFCRVCGYPFWGLADTEQSCPHCAQLDPVFGEGRTVALMEGPARRLIVELKYHRGLYVLRDLVTMAEQAPGYLQFLEGAVLVPVPLHWTRARKRGFNQSESIARALAQRASGARVCGLLKRTQPTTTQTRLQRTERERNVRHAFALRREPDAGLKLERCVLVDDVFTTGATLNACARVLRSAGIRRLDVATICHG